MPNTIDLEQIVDREINNAIDNIMLCDTTKDAEDYAAYITCYWCIPDSATELYAVWTSRTHHECYSASNHAQELLKKELMRVRMVEANPNLYFDD